MLFLLGSPRSATDWPARDDRLCLQERLWNFSVRVMSLQKRAWVMNSGGLRLAVRICFRLLTSLSPTSACQKWLSATLAAELQYEAIHASRSSDLFHLQRRRSTLFASSAFEIKSFRQPCLLGLARSNLGLHQMSSTVHSLSSSHNPFPALPASQFGEDRHPRSSL